MPPAPRQRGAQEQREVRGNASLATAINESSFVLDEQILDPESPLAVQIPEGVGADGSSVTLALAETYAEGHVEAKFEDGRAPLPSVSDINALDDDQKKHVRSVGEAGESDDAQPDFDRVETYPVHPVPAVRREAAAGENVHPDSLSEEETADKDKPKVPEKADATSEPDPTDRSQVEEANKVALGDLDPKKGRD